MAAKTPVGRSGQPQDLLGRRDGRLEAEVGPVGRGLDRGVNPSFAEGGHVAVIAGVIDQAVVAAEHRDPPMAELQQVLHRRHAALPVACPDAGQRLDPD